MIEDCWEHCEGKLCNDNLDISKNFQPGPGEDSVTECHTCKHEEIIDGQVSDIERHALASKFAEVLPIVLESCARFLERPCMIKEVELVEIRSDDIRERRA